MQADKTTISDLSIFTHEEELSVFHQINFTKTIAGKEWLRIFLSKPFIDLDHINQTQQIIQRILHVLSKWPQIISNGTIMVIDKFYDTPLEEIPDKANIVNGLYYKIFNSPDYSILRYSITHFIDFIKGLKEIIQQLSQPDNPAILQTILDRMQMLLNKPLLQKMLHWNKRRKMPLLKALEFGDYMRSHFKSEALELIEIYSKLDAWYSMAKACEHYKFCFPDFIESDQPTLSAQQLYHPLLAAPVAYDVALTPQQNFLFLTGANMAGKSTFIKAVGVAVYLAHTGMGVPAKTMKLSLFDGLLSNIQVVDNIINGESYFFNEVQRIRKTIEKISNGKKWLILIDELFKGTNVQDAMRCSTVVIEGLRKMQNALFILSTHLYEIGEELKQYPNIQFRYFETEVNEDQLSFSYKLKNGISNDRLGYLILKREGVVELLHKL
jgi:DNA mismatch repair ATPase MutS